jgi:hypothetical protein
VLTLARRNLRRFLVFQRQRQPSVEEEVCQSPWILCRTLAVVPANQKTRGDSLNATVCCEISLICFLNAMSFYLENNVIKPLKKRKTTPSCSK